MTAFAYNNVRFNGAMLTGISSPVFDRREQQAPIASDATLHQTGAGVIRAAPMARFMTMAMRALFVVLGTGDEIPFVAGDATNGIELLALKISTTGPGYDAAAVHVKRQMPRCDLYLKSIRWAPGSVVEAECEAFGYSAAGGTDPVTVAANMALPTLPTNQEQLILSGLSIGATQVTRVRSLDISIDHKGENNAEPLCFDRGLPYPVLPTKAGVGGQTEILCTIDTLDMDTAFANGVVTAVFSVVNHLGIGASASTATVTINGTLVREQALEGGGRRLLIRGTFDGSNKPITIATA